MKRTITVKLTLALVAGLFSTLAAQSPPADFTGPTDYATAVRLDAPLSWYRFQDPSNVAGATARDEPHAQIGVARSRDGLTNWQRHVANPIIRPGPNRWDHDTCYKPYAIFDGQPWLLWYNGRHDSLEQIGVAVHRGENLGFHELNRRDN